MSKQTAAGAAAGPPPEIESGVASSEAFEETTDERTVPSTVIVLAIPGWLAVLFGVDVVPSTLWGTGFIGVWAALPVAFSLDAWTLRDTGKWRQHWPIYVLTSVIWIVAIIPAAVSLWRR